MLEKYLQEIGLSDKEASIYLALLQVDNASVLDLSKKTSIKRPTVYVILESLAKKGLVSETTIGKKTQYQAEPPERLETFIERQKVVLEDHSRMLKDLIPQIKSVHRQSGERPIVKYFEGREGVISSMVDLFNSPDAGGGVTYIIYPDDLLKDIFTQEERERYRAIRIKKNIKSKAIYTSSNEARPSDAMGDRIKVNGKEFPISCDITIYKDKVRISILGKKVSGIFINSPELADTMRTLFDLAFSKNK